MEQARGRSCSPSSCSRTPSSATDIMSIWASESRRAGEGRLGRGVGEPVTTEVALPLLGEPAVDAGSDGLSRRRRRVASAPGRQRNSDLAGDRCRRTPGRCRRGPSPPVGPSSSVTSQSQNSGRHGWPHIVTPSGWAQTPSDIEQPQQGLGGLLAGGRRPDLGADIAAEPVVVGRVVGVRDRRLGPEAARRPGRRPRRSPWPGWPARR